MIIKVKKLILQNKQKMLKLLEDKIMIKYLVVERGTTGEPIMASMDVADGVALIERIGVVSKTKVNAWQEYSRRCFKKAANCESNIAYLQEEMNEKIICSHLKQTEWQNKGVAAMEESNREMSSDGTGMMEEAFEKWHSEMEF